MPKVRMRRRRSENGWNIKIIPKEAVYPCHSFSPSDSQIVSGNGGRNKRRKLGKTNYVVPRPFGRKALVPECERVQ